MYLSLSDRIKYLINILCTLCGNSIILYVIKRMNTKIPSPARSVREKSTPRRRYNPRSHSVGSARSVKSTRLSALIQDIRKEDSVLSPVSTPKSILTDNTDIVEPRRKSWWKKLDKSIEDMAIFQPNPINEVNDILDDYIQDDINSQENKKYTLDLPDSSSNESIASIKVPQTKLFTLRENGSQRRFSNMVEKQNCISEQEKNTDTEKTLHIAVKLNSQRSRLVFPAALLNMSSNSINKTKVLPNIEQRAPAKKLFDNKSTNRKRAFTNFKFVDSRSDSTHLEPKIINRNLFGANVANKRKTRYSDLIATETDEDIPEIIPKVFGFPKSSKHTQYNLISIKQGHDLSPSSSVASDTEFNSWKMLPSSTMVDDNLLEKGTPSKKLKIGILLGQNESEKTKQNEDLRTSSVQSISKNTSKIHKLYETNENDEINEQGMKNQNRDHIMNKSKNNITISKNKSKSKVSLQEDNLDNIRNTVQEIMETRNAVSLKERTIDKSKTEVNNIENENNELLKENDQFRKKIDDNNFDMNVSKEDEIIKKQRKNLEKEHVILLHEDIEKRNRTIEMSPANRSEKHTSNSENFEKETENIVGETEKKGSESESDTEMEIKKQIEKQLAGCSSGSEKHKSDSSDIEQEPNNIHEKADREEGELVTEMEKQIEKLFSSPSSRFIKHKFNINDIEQEPRNIVKHAGREKNESETELEKQIEKEHERSFVQDEERELTDVNEGLQSGEHGEKVSELQSVLEDEISEIPEPEEDSENSEHESENKSSDQDTEQDDEHELSNEENQDDNISTNSSKSQQLGSEIDESKETSKNEQNENNIEKEIENSNNKHEESNNDSKTVKKNLHNVIVEQTPEEITDSSKHDKTNKTEESLLRSPEGVLHGDIDNNDSLPPNPNSFRKTNILVHKTIHPSFATHRGSLEFQNETENSSAEGSGWDSHRTTRRTLRQTFGKDFSLRKSLRTLVMEKYAKRHTTGELDAKTSKTVPNLQENIEVNRTTDQCGLIDQNTPVEQSASIEQNASIEQDACTEQNASIEEGTFIAQNASVEQDMSVQQDTSVEQRTSFERNTYIEQEISIEQSATIEQDISIEENASIEQEISIEQSATIEQDTSIEENASIEQEISIEESATIEQDISIEENASIVRNNTIVGPFSRKQEQTTLLAYLQNIGKKAAERRAIVREKVMNSLKAPVDDSMEINLYKPKHKSFKGLAKPMNKNSHVKRTPLGLVPQELLEDFKYKPPKRFAPRNASWITKRLYKFIETKLEPKYDYRARVRAEKFIQYLYKFTMEFKKDMVCPNEAIKHLKLEMARLDIVRTHFEFYNFFRDYLPREIRIKIIPDIVNKLPLPKRGVFSDILPPNMEQ